LLLDFTISIITIIIIIIIRRRRKIIIIVVKIRQNLIRGKVYTRSALRNNVTFTMLFM